MLIGLSEMDEGTAYYFYKATNDGEHGCSSKPIKIMVAVAHLLCDLHIQNGTSLAAVLSHLYCYYLAITKLILPAEVITSRISKQRTSDQHPYR